MNREIEHVEQVSLQQRLSEQTMTIDQQIPCFLLLELAHFCHHIASHDGRVAPLGLFQLDENTYLGIALMAWPTRMG
jgi:hypothetical protein